MTIIIDRSEEVDGFEMPPEGPYMIEVAEADERTARRSGAPYINVRLKIIEGDWEGKASIWDNLMMGGKGVGIGIRKAAGLGLELEGVAQVDADDFIGRRAVCHIVHGEYDGKKNLKVDIEQGDYAGYDRIGDALPKGGPKRTPRLHKPPAQGEDYNFDDIPF